MINITGKWTDANIEQAEGRFDRSNVIRWIVRWEFNNVCYAEGYEFHIKAINKQLMLQEIGIESIIECAR